MKQERKFIISVNDNSYIIENNKNEHGYFYFRTRILNNAKIWKNKKNCENIIKKILENPDPNHKHIKENNLNIVETTNENYLRYLKLKKINKKLW